MYIPFPRLNVHVQLVLLNAIFEQSVSPEFDFTFKDEYCILVPVNVTTLVVNTGVDPDEYGNVFKVEITGTGLGS